MEEGLPSPTMCLEARVSMGLEIVLQRWVLGGTDYQVDRDIENQTRISGAGIEDAGCNKSEMK